MHFALFVGLYNFILILGMNLFEHEGKAARVNLVQISVVWAPVLLSCWVSGAGPVCCGVVVACETLYFATFFIL